MIFIDQMDRIIELKEYPKKIISLVPSQSELLWDLGLQKELIGITKFCIHPKEMFQSVERVGGTKKLDINKIRLLKPDLIIGNKEENEQSQIEELSQEFPVWMSDIYHLDDALQMMQLIGELTNKKQEALSLSIAINESFKNLKQKHQRVLYLIWKSPYMASGKATFIGDMLSKIGLKNVLEDNKLRYPSLTIEEIKILNPDIIFLSTEPYPFKEQDILDLEKQLKTTKVILVDGELFSWYGSRLLKSADYFNTLH